jgi:hypothetical protein
MKERLCRQFGVILFLKKVFFSGAIRYCFAVNLSRFDALRDKGISTDNALQREVSL